MNVFGALVVGVIFGAAMLIAVVAGWLLGGPDVVLPWEENP